MGLMWTSHQLVLLLIKQCMQKPLKYVLRRVIQIWKELFYVWSYVAIYYCNLSLLWSARLRDVLVEAYNYVLASGSVDSVLVLQSWDSYSQDCSRSNEASQVGNISRVEWKTTWCSVDIITLATTIDQFRKDIHDTALTNLKYADKWICKGHRSIQYVLPIIGATSGHFGIHTFKWCGCY